MRNPSIFGNNRRKNGKFGIKRIQNTPKNISEWTDMIGQSHLNCSEGLKCPLSANNNLMCLGLVAIAEQTTSIVEIRRKSGELAQNRAKKRLFSAFLGKKIRCDCPTPYDDKRRKYLCFYQAMTTTVR